MYMVNIHQEQPSIVDYKFVFTLSYLIFIVTLTVASFRHLTGYITSTSLYVKHFKNLLLDCQD